MREQSDATGRSSAFEADDCQLCFQPDVVKAWIYGHTHFTEEHRSLEENEVPIYSNQVGYIGKEGKRDLPTGKSNENFNGQFVLDVECIAD